MTPLIDMYRLENLVEGGVYTACYNHMCETTNYNTSSDWDVEWSHQVPINDTHECDYCGVLD